MRTTWGQLLDGFTIDDLRHALLPRGAEQSSSWALFCWSLRWASDPSTGEANSKREVIMKHLQKGRLVALQEVHWWNHHAAQWRALSPGASVRYSCAIPGPHDGPEGGVAVIFPSCFHIERFDIIDPGHVVEVVVSKGQERLRILNVYLPPTNLQTPITAIEHYAFDPFHPHHFDR